MVGSSIQCWQSLAGYQQLQRIHGAQLRIHGGVIKLWCLFFSIHVGYFILEQQIANLMLQKILLEKPWRLLVKWPAKQSWTSVWQSSMAKNVDYFLHSVIMKRWLYRLLDVQFGTVLAFTSIKYNWISKHIALPYGYVLICFYK